MSAAVTLVVPVYNETARFAGRAPALAEFVGRQPEGSDLIIVDDGSSDGTPELVESFLAEHPSLRGRLLRRPHRGKGAAVQAGLDVATAPYAGFCDVDLATPLADFGRLADLARARGALVIGSRDVPEAKLVRHESQLREALGKTFNRAVRAVAVPGIADTQCGAKVAPTATWREILPHVRETGFAWDVEVLAVAQRLGIEVLEVGVEWAHDPDSRVHVLRDGARMVRALPRIRRSARRAAGAPRRGGAERGVFDAENAAALAGSDDTHWWFRSKALHVSAALARHGSEGLLIDVGAGSGGVTSQLSWSGPRLATDGNEDLVDIARDRHGLDAIVADVGSVGRPAGSAAAVCLLDVIEHLPDEEPALREAHRLLRPGGRLVVTVPAHAALWSETDVALGHFRRYARGDLQRLLELNGFDVLELTHLFSYLFLPVWVRRRVASGGQPQLGLGTQSPLVDTVATLLARAEEAVVARRALGVGTSLLAVAGPRPR